MDGEHNYEISLKKDDLFINLSSDDVYFISKQMDKWFHILLDDSYIPVSLAKPQPAPQPLPQQPAPMPQPVSEAPQPMPEPTPVQAPVYQPPPAQPYVDQPQPVYQQPVQPAPQYAEIYQQPAPMPQPAPQPVVQPAPQPAEVYQQPAFVQPAPPPMPQPVAAQAPAMSDIQLPLAQPQAMPPAQQPQQMNYRPQPEVPQAALDPAVTDDFEAMMSSLMEDLEPAPETYQEPMPHVATAVMPPNGNGRMEASAAGLPAVSSLAELCDQSHAGSSEDYLLLSAYYLTHFERLDKFSLKRINAMLVKSGLTPVNHSVLESSLTRGYLSMVPDLTGMADVSEYALTAEGQQAAGRLL